MIGTECVTISSYSIADFGRRIRGKLHFPHSGALPSGSVGYVRSAARALASAQVRGGKHQIDTPLPWRDYPAEVLTASSDVLETPFHEDYLLLGCRNVLNEWGYQVRLDGTWWRRAGDQPVDERWPVLAMLPEGVRFLPAAESRQIGADLLTGLPVVIDGVASETDFLIANCSDVAHVFEVHPGGLIGPSPAAWLELTNAWQAAHSENLPHPEFAALMLAIARKYGVTASRHTLHSLIAEAQDGTLRAFALNGSLKAIAQHLVQRWKVTNAILLDNGGSVGWFYCPRDRSTPTLLVGGPNRRDSGTAFLSLETRGFPQPRMHTSLMD